MHIYTRFLIATITLFTFAAYAEPESSQMVVDAPPEAVAVHIKDKPVTVETLTSYATIMKNLQGASWDRPGDLLADYVFSSLASDLTLSGTRHVQEPPTIPSDYPTIGQRRFLKKKYDEYLRANLEVPQDVMESWFEQNKDNYTQPEKVHAYHIFMETSDDVPSSAPEAVRAKMEEVKARADAGTSFSLLAEEYSEAASAQKGGEIGKLYRRMPIGPQSRPINLMLENAFFNLNPGQTSDIMSTTFGLHLLYTHDRQPTMTVTMDDLITSEILPNAALFVYLQDESKRLIAEFIRENDGAVAEFSEELTSDTASFRLGGTTFTVKHMEELYGTPFTRAYNQAKNSTETLAALNQQALEEEASVQLAAEKVANSSQDAEILQLIKDRADAIETVRTIIAEHYTVSEDEVKAEYEKRKEEFLLPEAEGMIVLVTPKQTTVSIEQARNLDKARRAAEEIQSRLTDGEIFESVLGSVSGNEFEVTGTVVTRHIIGNTTEPMEAALDRLVSSHPTGEANVWLGPAVQGDALAVGKITNRYPGSPAPLERVARSLQTSIVRATHARAQMEILDELVKNGKLKWGPAAKKFFPEDKPSSLSE